MPNQSSIAAPTRATRSTTDAPAFPRELGVIDTSLKTIEKTAGKAAAELQNQTESALPNPSLQLPIVPSPACAIAMIAAEEERLLAARASPLGATSGLTPATTAMHLDQTKIVDNNDGTKSSAQTGTSTGQSKKRPATNEASLSLWV